MLLLCTFTCLLYLAKASCNDTREAYAFTVYDQTSAVRALVTLQSLNDAGHTKETVVVVNDHAVSPLVMDKLNAAFDTVELLTLPDWFTHSTWVLEASVRPTMMAALPKLYLWRLTQYRRLVYLDSRAMVLKSIDELFMQSGFAAVPEVDSEEDFDAGMFVLTPSRDVFDQLLNVATDSDFTWSDQSILNSVIQGWTALSPIYNTPDLTSNLTKDGYALTESTKVIQFLNEPEPWFDVYGENNDVLVGSVNDVDYRLRWWHTFMKVKGDAPGGQKKPMDGSDNNGMYEEKEDEVKTKLARFRGTRAANDRHLRNKRAGCSANCKKGSCSCPGSCKCKCNIWANPNCKKSILE